MSSKLMALHNLRQTGRTTRMMEEAERLASEGRKVYVIFDSESSKLRMKDRFGWDKANDLGISFETEWSCSFDFLKMEPIGNPHPNCVFLVDHWVIEKKYHKMLAALHMFD